MTQRGGNGLLLRRENVLRDESRILADAPNTEESILVAKCDPKLIEETRRNWPFLRDRRIDAYGPILNRVID